MVDGRERKTRIVVHSKIDHISESVAELWQSLSTKAIRHQRPFAAALSGGTTPEPLYRHIAETVQPSLWEHTHIFPVDERMVPHDHEDSNFRLIDTALLSRIKIPEKNVHAVSTTAATASEAAALYDKELVSFFSLKKSMRPRFDLVLLGIGEDGHTASLFPGMKHLVDEKKLVVASESDNAPHARVTLTMPVINNASTVVFAVTGGRKAPIIKAILQDRDIALPASLVAPEDGELIVLLDREAASLLTKDLILIQHELGKVPFRRK